MMSINFMDMLQALQAEGKFVCLGLDPDITKIPRSIRREGMEHYNSLSANSFVVFNREIVERTHDLVSAYKPNFAFYEAYGDIGIEALRKTILHIRNVAPAVPVIVDFKRADIGNTNAGSIKMAFDYLQADAVTVNPYLGREALQPFLDYKDKGIIVLCRTSNPGSGEFQDLPVAFGNGHVTRPLYQVVANQVASKWNTNGNCLLVVGATYPDELKMVRDIVGDMSILIPGLGAQGGMLKKQ